VTATSEKSALLIGASRGLGYVLVEEYLNRGWRVVWPRRSSTCFLSTLGKE